MSVSNKILPHGVIQGKGEAFEEGVSKAIESGVVQVVEKNQPDLGSRSRPSVNIRTLLSNNEGIELDSEVLAGYYNVEHTERAVVFTVQNRMREELRDLPRVVSSVNFTYRVLQTALFQDDGRWSSIMRMFGEKVKEVIEKVKEI